MNDRSDSREDEEDAPDEATTSLRARQKARDVSSRSWDDKVAAIDDAFEDLASDADGPTIQAGAPLGRRELTDDTGEDPHESITLNPLSASDQLRKITAKTDAAIVDEDGWEEASTMSHAIGGAESSGPFPGPERTERELDFSVFQQGLAQKLPVRAPRAVPISDLVFEPLSPSGSEALPWPRDPANSRSELTSSDRPPQDPSPGAGENTPPPPGFVEKTQPPQLSDPTPALSFDLTPAVAVDPAPPFSGTRPPFSAIVPPPMTIEGDTGPSWPPREPTPPPPPPSREFVRVLPAGPVRDAEIDGVASEEELHSKARGPNTSIRFGNIKVVKSGAVARSTDPGFAAHRQGGGRALVVEGAERLPSPFWRALKIFGLAVLLIVGAVIGFLSTVHFSTAW